MKTLYNNIKLLAGVIVLALLAVSCVPEQQSMGDAGQTLIKLTPQDYTMVPLNAIETSQTALMFEVRRDVHSKAALNSSTTVILKKDDTMIDDWNTEYGETFIPLPTSLGTTSVTPAADGTVTVELGAGEFLKAVMLTVPDATQFDFNEKYALAYRLISSSGTGAISEAYPDSVFVQVLVKNKYDGVYEITAITDWVDASNADLIGWYPFTYELETSGANSVTCLLVDPGYYNYYHPLYSISGDYISVYGSYGLELVFDEATGEVTAINNVWGNPPANTRMPALDPSGVNKWDEATGDITLKYYMLQPSVVVDPPHIRCSFDEYWEYQGPR